jgi:hypothetical protein
MVGFGMPISCSKLEEVGNIITMPFLNDKISEIKQILSNK